MSQEWNLTWWMRVVIVGLAVGYLLFAWPWGEVDSSKSFGVYSCVAALVTLALIPRRTRLWVAMGVSIGVPLVAVLVARFVGD